MFSFYNPNPTGKNVGDCAVRALSKALGQDWLVTYLGICIQGALAGDMPSANAVWGVTALWQLTLSPTPIAAMATPLAS